MPTYWHKRDWWQSDMDRSDPYKPEFVPSAIPPGIYCEEQEGRTLLLKRSSERATEAAIDWRGHASIGGIKVFVATPAQADIFRALPTDEPAPPQDLDGGSLTFLNSMIDRFKRMAEFGSVPRPGAQTQPFKERRRSTMTNAIVSGVEFMMGRDPAPPPEVRHPSSGANRKAKRAAEAQARRRA